MCIMCVEIMRERITVTDALKGFREAVGAGDTDKHVVEILQADNNGDVEKVKELVKAGYKKERWI